MRKLLLILFFISNYSYLFSQSEIKSDSIYSFINENYKEYGEFLLDMGLFNIQSIEMPKFDIKLDKNTKDFTKIFSLNPDITYSKGLSTIFTPSFSSFGNSNLQNMQMGSFKLKNGMRINTYGDYNSNGFRVPNRSAMPWEKNNFRGAFELKSANGNFGIKVEVQQGRNQPFP